MTHFATPRFWRCYRKLPEEVRRLADRNFSLLKTAPSHRSLQLKHVGQLWSARVGLHYRTLAVEAASDLVWFWIGSHAEYDKLVGRKPASTRGQSTRTAVRSRKAPGRARS